METTTSGSGIRKGSTRVGNMMSNMYGLEGAQHDGNHTVEISGLVVDGVPEGKLALRLRDQFP